MESAGLLQAPRCSRRHGTWRAEVPTEKRPSTTRDWPTHYAWLEETWDTAEPNLARPPPMTAAYLGLAPQPSDHVWRLLEDIRQVSR